MNKHGNNTVIKVLTEEHGEKVIEYYKSLGCDTGFYVGSNCEELGHGRIYYGVIDGHFSNYFADEIPNEVKIIELPKEEPQPKPLTYPRVMEVSDDEKIWDTRVVFIEKCGMYVAWANAKTLERAETIIATTSWKYAREIAPKVEVTKQQIAETFNTTIDNLIIKED